MPFTSSQIYPNKSGLNAFIDCHVNGEAGGLSSPQRGEELFLVAFKKYFVLLFVLFVAFASSFATFALNTQHGFLDNLFLLCLNWCILEQRKSEEERYGNGIFTT
ncbi:MAG: hypothetical protein A3J65_02945 [Candidatus Buchananbacteria bacterium RIFCSPHIGHO2_02_FULL_45_11b]|uniref:Uncharacterized protein n=2 Tax=Candidatus Buchananiibacteriota TaxID=1817903 RepID=A0A1G1YKP6_9BACT|nr:MAG: hypothetical protein A3J65_02945 [Candidatus Buchananbacteria bacterium RIFCSPHIGHO2_02_FULL_45_11b]OGY54365.1 MAG: hypothetical protein A3B15_02375 [Candidatus Buchananbacteria bacterium RIFCSPLOWO2_01_FULL_45_31]